MIGAFAQDCPPPAKIIGKPVSEQRVGESLHGLYGQVAKYVQDKHLGVIGRARLAMALQDEMRQREYPADLVSRLVHAVTVNALVAPERR